MNGKNTNGKEALTQPEGVVTKQAESFKVDVVMETVRDWVDAIENCLEKVNIWTKGVDGSIKSVNKRIEIIDDQLREVKERLKEIDEMMEGLDKAEDWIKTLLTNLKPLSNSQSR